MRYENQKRRRVAASPLRQSLIRLNLILLMLMISVEPGMAQESTLPGQKFEDQGRKHVAQDYIFQYNSSPPTSGPHAKSVGWGQHSTEIPEVNQVHNLEHGGILIQYNCGHLPVDQSCRQLRSALRRVLKKGFQQVDRKLILAPYSKMPHLIATTAWTRLQYFDSVDEGGILKFAKTFINQGPEYVK